MVIGSAIFALFMFVLVPIMYRRVVPTNEVHIIQNRKNTVSYGKDTGKGNVYYAFPSWVPLIGITTTKMPVDNFSLELIDYEAQDKDRIPFVLDVVAFFRIKNSDIAAQRVSSFGTLKEQLTAILQGAIRAVLAGSDINEILQGRSTFGAEFTKEVSEQLENWGVEAVKNVELMDIRDGKGSTAIHSIMDKKKSLIDMESRLEVAKNKKLAQIAEIEAQREVDLQKQEATQQVGLRTVEAKRRVEIAEEEKKQLVNEQLKTTTEKQAEVLRVQKVKAAEIEKQAQIIKAEQDRETARLKAEQDKTTAVLKAEQEKQTTLLAAEANFEAVNKQAEAELNKNVKYAEGSLAIGKAKAESETLLLLAPVEAQTTLAQKIGENKSYQEYLISIEKVKADQAIGVAQAEALAHAEIKVIANTGNASSGIKSLGELFTSQGGSQIGAMLEGLANTDTGKALLNKAGLDQ